MVAFKVLEEDVVDCLGRLAVPEGAYDCTSRLVAGDVLGDDVLGVAFYRDAVLCRRLGADQVAVRTGKRTS